MNHRYAHILSPIKVGNLVLKNRLINSKCIPEGIQGPQTWPTEQTINFAASLAKNGAAIVYLCPGNVPGLCVPTRCSPVILTWRLATSSAVSGG